MKDPHLENAEIVVKKRDLARWAWLVGLVAFFALAFFLALDAEAPTAPGTPKALGASASPAPDPCGLAVVECPQEAGEVANLAKSDPSRVIVATVYTYQAVPEQTDATPCVGALAGVDFCNPPFPIVANNCLKLGTKVEIRGVEYTVADRMADRHGCEVFDRLMPGSTTLTSEPVIVLNS